MTRKQQLFLVRDKSIAPASTAVGCHKANKDGGNRYAGVPLVVLQPEAEHWPKINGSPKLTRQNKVYMLTWWNAKRQCFYHCQYLMPVTVYFLTAFEDDKMIRPVKEDNLKHLPANVSEKSNKC